jgi:Lar family restriction alleviation protein
MPSTKKKPCPFCESKNVRQTSLDANFGYYVVCDDCSAQGPMMYYGKKEAVEAWNKRGN